MESKMKHPSSKLGLPPDLQRQSKGNKMRRIFTGLAMASFLMLGISTAAYAYDPQLPATCDGGNNVPDGSFTGGVISSIGGCNLSESITASSAVSVTSDGAVNVTGSLSAPGVTVQSTGSTVSVGAITSSAFIDILAHDANNTVYNSININGSISATLATNIEGSNITSSVPLTSAAITSHGGGTVNLVALKGGVDVTNDSGDINVVGNVGDSTTTSVYMSAGDAIGNGNIKVSGTVSTTSANLAIVQLFAGGNISTGAITSPDIEVLANEYGITSTSTFLLGGGGINGISGAVTAKNTAGGGGYIDIENGYQTGTGNMTVTDGDVVETGTTGNYIGLWAHGGTLVLPGGPITAGGPESQVAIVGKIVDFGDGTNISSDYLAGGSTHNVVIEADTINYAGTSVVTANGSGQDSNDAGAVFVQGYTSGTTQVQFVGASGATMSLGADGDHTYTQVYADAISFATGGVTLHSKGTTDHGVYLTDVDDTATSDNLTVASGTLTLDASGANGAGGVVNVDVYKAVLNGTLITLNANGPMSGSGDGGTISFYADNTSIGASAVIKLTANAASAGTGNAIYADPTTANPVAISFEPGTITDLYLGTAAGQVSFSANGGSAGGNGGTISASLTDTGSFDLATAGAVSASALAGDSNGGWVYLDAYLKTVANNASEVTAIGKGTGNGGQFVGFNHVVNGFDINKAIKVDAGSNTPVAQQDGSISLNGEVCGQWKIGTGTGNTDWPMTYWNCVNPTAPAQPDSQPPLLANSTNMHFIAPTLGMAPVQLYVFPNSSNYYTFSNTTGPTNVQGLTVPPTSSDTTMFSNIFMTGLINDQAGTDVAQETTAHELGHAYDFTQNVQSATGPYLTYVAADFSFLDYTQLEDSAADSAPYLRSPCVGATAPFAGLGDETTGKLICVSTPTTGYTLIPGSSPSTYIESDLIPGGVLMRNSQILQLAALDIRWNSTRSAWFENYAQMISFQAYVKTEPNNDNYGQFLTDNLLANGWFDCSLDWAGNILATAPVPPTTAPAPYPSAKGFGACNSVPGWYRTLLGH
jgi:hypothetical protein